MAREDRRASDTSTVQDKSLPRMLRMFWITMRDISRMQDRRMQDAEHRNGRHLWKTRQGGLHTTRQNKDPRLWTQTHIWCEPAQAKCTWTCHKRRFILKFAGKMPGPRESRTRTHILCEPAPSKCTCTFHRSNFIKKYGWKCRSPECGHTLCASLRNRNALWHFTRATL